MYVRECVGSIIYICYNIYKGIQSYFVCIFVTDYHHIVSYRKMTIVSIKEQCKVSSTQVLPSAHVKDWSESPHFC